MSGGTIGTFHALVDFIAANREKVNKSTYCIPERITEFDAVVANALELGELHREAIVLTHENEA